MKLLDVTFQVHASDDGGHAARGARVVEVRANEALQGGCMRDDDERSWFERTMDRLAFKIAQRLGTDGYARREIADRLARIDKRLDKVIDHITTTPTAAARTYEVGYDEKGNAIVAIEPMPRADCQRGANFAVAHDNARNGRSA